MADGRQTGTTADEAEFALAPLPQPLFRPLMMGITVGLVWIVGEERTPGPLRVAIGAMLAILSATIFLWVDHRRTADRVRVAREAVELRKGTRVVKRVRFARLVEVNQFETPQGPVLLVRDDRGGIAFAASQLVEPREYPQLTGSIVAALSEVDPSGELGRRAVQSGKLAVALAGRRVRGAVLLAGLTGLAASLSFGAAQALASRPYPFEAMGALSLPLVEAGETFRLLSYVFIHASWSHLIPSLAGLLVVGSWLERLVGWERVVLGFFAGAIGGAIGHLMSPLATPGIGSTAAFFGLLGMTHVVWAINKRRGNMWLAPPPLIVMLSVLFVVFTSLPLLVHAPAAPGLLLFTQVLTGQLGFIPVLSPLAHLGGYLMGALVGFAVIAGTPLPFERPSQIAWRPFAILAGLALAIGLVGGVTHMRRDGTEHPDDAELVTLSLLEQPPSALVAEQLNEIAYRMLMVPQARPELLSDAERLAEAAVARTNRKAAHILDTLAVARFQSGDLDDARALLEEALNLPDAEQWRPLLERRLRDVNAGGPLTPDSQPFE